MKLFVSSEQYRSEQISLAIANEDFERAAELRDAELFDPGIPGYNEGKMRTYSIILPESICQGPNLETCHGNQEERP